MVSIWGNYLLLYKQQATGTQSLSRLFWWLIIANMR